MNLVLITAFVDELTKVGQTLTDGERKRLFEDDDLFGHRTKDPEPIMASGRLLSGADAARVGTLKSQETSESDSRKREKVKVEPKAEPQEFRSEIFLTKGLVPTSTAYGRYGVLVHSDDAKPSRYLNDVPEEHVVEEVPAKPVFVVPDGELKKWEKSHPNRSILPESEVPADFRLPARDPQAREERKQLGAKREEKTETVVVGEKAGKDAGSS